ncbi:MAG: SUF system NifU family Fe-S cluster assembly protein [Acidobacteria bacterium]|nr:MAG: SUF system NifU family Fe-S cluster assembly protein [Acidobacteriota bacterium]
MGELDELYQEMVLDHGKRPRNRGRLEEPSARAEGYNPLCGDRLTLYLKIEGDVVTDARFEGSGCAISTASTSLMTEAVKGKPVSEVDRLFRLFHDMLTGPEEAAEPPEELGKLAALAGVRKFPIRVKCATLPWHTLKAALAGERVASTE